MANRQFMYPWYPTYRTAMLSDENDLVEQVENALRAIQVRLADMQGQIDDCERENLNQALRYLSLLTRCFKAEGGKLLWC